MPPRTAPAVDPASRQQKRPARSTCRTLPLTATPGPEVGNPTPPSQPTAVPAPQTIPALLEENGVWLREVGPPPGDGWAWISEVDQPPGHGGLSHAGQGSAEANRRRHSDRALWVAHEVCPIDLEEHAPEVSRLNAERGECNRRREVLHRELWHCENRLEEVEGRLDDIHTPPSPAT